MAEDGTDNGSAVILNGIQAGLFDRWKNLLDRNDFEAYFLDVRSSIRNPTINATSINILRPFYFVEKIYGLYKQPEFSGPYKAIFVLIGNDLLLRDVLSAFNFDFFMAGELLLESGIRLERTGRSEGIIELLSGTYDQAANDGDKIVHAARLCLCELFSGEAENARIAFIKRCMDLNMLKLYEEYGGIPMKEFSIIFRSILPSLDEVLGILTQHCFDEELFFLREIYIRKSNFLLVTAVLWHIYGHQTSFLGLYEKWVKLFHKAIEKDLSELVFYMVWPISHIYGNLSQTQTEWKRLNDDVYRPLSGYISGRVAQACDIKPVEKHIASANDKIKIGFVYARMVLNSPFKVLYSLLKGLKEYGTASYELYVYDLEYIDKTPSDPGAVRMIEGLGVFYRSNHKMIDDSDKWLFYSHFDKCVKLREAIIDDGIDVLIGTGGWEQNVFLFATRSAPVQVYWSHGNYVYDVDGIDYRIMHSMKASIVASELKEGHEFHLFPAAMDKQFYIPEVDMNKMKEIRSRYPKEALILGFIGRMIKMESDEYLEAVAAIMKQNANTIFLACGPGGRDAIQMKVKQFGLADRFFFEGFVDPHVYGYVIDLFMDTFPLGCGESLNEFCAKGRAFVSLQPEQVSPEERKNYPFCESSITFSNENYIEVADHLLKDEECRKKIASIVGKFAEGLFINSHNQANMFLSIVRNIGLPVVKVQVSADDDNVLISGKQHR